MKRIHFLILIFLATSFFSCTKMDVGSCPNCPQVLSLFPDAAQYDDTVLIIGKNLLPDPDFNDKLEVKFNGILIPENYIIDYDDESILLTIPKGTQSGPVTIDINVSDELTGSVSADFTYLPKFSLNTYAGTPGQPGNINNENPLSAYFYDPTKLAVDNISGDLYVYESDNNTFGSSNSHNLRKIEYNGTVTFLKNFSNEGISAIACKDGQVYVSHQSSSNVIGKLVFNGAQWNIDDIVGKDNNNGNSKDGDFATAEFKSIESMAFDTSGNLFVIDGNSIRKISFSGNSGSVSTIAGSSNPGFVDNVVPIDARFRNPSSLTVEDNGTIYISDKTNHRIRKLTPNLVSTIAGTGTSGGDSTLVSASSALLHNPAAIISDYNGNLFFHESNSPYIRKLNILDNKLSVYAGAWTSTGYSDDWIIPSSARFNMDIESGMAYDKTRKILYIADTYNDVIRKISSE